MGERQTEDFKVTCLIHVHRNLGFIILNQNIIISFFQKKIIFHFFKKDIYLHKFDLI